jgi:cation diffusion facilitator family transporter
MAGGSTKAVVAAMAANGSIAIAKFVGFGVTGSASMLAEAIHSVADTSNQGLLLYGGRAARKEADDQHQFGYGRERYFWSFMVALVLFTLGGGYATYEGILKIRDPHEIDNLPVAIGILVFAIVVESLSFRTAIVEANKIKLPATSWWQFIRRSRSPELPVVLLEDAGALLGLIFALFAVVMAEVTGNAVWDGVGTLAIGLLLFAIAIVLIIEMKSLLLGEGAKKAEMAAIRHAIESSPGVEKLIHIKTQYIAPEELLVGAKVVFDNTFSVDELAAAVDRVESAVRAEVHHARPMYIEPDLHRSEAELRASQSEMEKEAHH